MEAQIVNPPLITSTATLSRAAFYALLKGLSFIFWGLQWVTVQEISAGMLSQVVNGFEKEVLGPDDLRRIGQDALSKGEE